MQYSNNLFLILLILLQWVYKNTLFSKFEIYIMIILLFSLNLLIVFNFRNCTFAHFIFRKKKIKKKM